MSFEAVNIILVEDDDGHATLIERNLRRAALTNNFLRLKDGQEALDYFSKPDPCGKSELTPGCLVLLDIKMPRVDGVEVLRRMKANPKTATIPVIMLTTTDDPREIERCYQLGCNVYVTKPVEYEAFLEAVKRLGLFLQVVKLPVTGTAGTS
ncbi:MAG TPA: response regulator [Tepidisphaeraceae bacterium]|jgi:CheY-like chemotaxis protein